MNLHRKRDYRGRRISQFGVGSFAGGGVVVSDPISDLVSTYSPLLLLTDTTGVIGQENTPPEELESVVTWEDQSGNNRDGASTFNGEGEANIYLYSTTPPLGIADPTDGVSYFNMNTINRSGTPWEVWAVFYRASAGKRFSFLADVQGATASVFAINSEELVECDDASNSLTSQSATITATGLCACRFRVPNNGGGITYMGTGQSLVTLNNAANGLTFSLSSVMLINDTNSRLRFIMILPAISDAAGSADILAKINAALGTSLTLG